jgi:hypothetical protein
MESLRKVGLIGSTGAGYEKELTGNNSIKHPNNNPRIIEFKYFI